MTNKIMVEAHVEKMGLVIGSYDRDLEILTKKATKEFLAEVLDESDRDVVVSMRGKQYIIEVQVVGNEMDFTLYTKNEYLDKYGDEYEYKFE